MGEQKEFFSPQDRKESSVTPEQQINEGELNEFINNAIAQAGRLNPEQKGKDQLAAALLRSALRIELDTERITDLQIDPAHNAEFQTIVHQYLEEKIQPETAAKQIIAILVK